MKKLILFFLLLSGVAYGQTSNTTNTKFTNGVAVPNGATQKPTSGLTAGALSYVTGAGLYVYNGSAWVLLGLSSGGVTSFNARTGVVVPEIGDYSSFYVPLTRSLTINGATQTLAADRTWTITANTPNSLTNGYGLTGGVFDGSVARTWVADTSSVSGLVSKLRLATNLAGYVKKATTITINGVTQDLSDNRIWTAGTVTSITPGYGLTPQTAITSAGGFAVDTLVLDTVYAKIGDIPSISFGTFGSTPNAQGGSYSGGVITLQPADATNPGGLSTIAQTIGGAKSLTDALSLIGTNSTLNFNRSVNTQSATQYFITNSIAKWRVGLTPTTDDNYHIKNETTATDALSIDNSTNVMTLSSLSAGGLVKSTSGALGIASTSDLNTSGVVLTTTNQSISDRKTFTGDMVFQSSLSTFLASVGATTGGSGIEIANTGGQLRLGTEGSSGGVFFTGSSAYASVFGSQNNTPIQFFTNNALRLTIANSGGVSATGSISSTPQGTLYGTASGSITSAQLATSLTDETGTGSAVFSASPTFTGTVIAAEMTTGDITTNADNKGYYFNGSRNAILGNNATNEVSIGTANLISATFNSSGDITIRGSNATKASGTAWINPSDLRLKTNVGEYSKGLAEVLKIKPKTWYFNEASGFDTTKLHLSPIAQELKLVMPEMVSTYKGKLNGKAQELLQVDASDMTWLLVKAIQEQQAIIEKLNARITVLENK